jgi:hypothetical protein
MAQRDEDDGRDLDLVLHLGRRACRLKLGELAAAAGMSDSKAVSAALRRHERRLAAEHLRAGTVETGIPNVECRDVTPILCRF